MANETTTASIASETTADPETQAMTPEMIARLVSSHGRFLAFLERRVASREAA
jgi:hypothetical protein